MTDGSKQYLNSKYIPILVQKGRLNESVQKMAQYVYDHQEKLMLNGEPKPDNIAGFKDGGYKTLSAQILLAEEIALIYETNYGYFKKNCRSHFEKTSSIEHLERVQYITPATINYLVSHPEQLKQVNCAQGIRIKKNTYHPQRVLSLQNTKAYDIYENMIVLSFLQKMIDDILVIQDQCKDLLKNIPNNEYFDSEYLYSSVFMFSETKRMLNNSIQGSPSKSV